MVPNPYGLYDDDARERTRWALREGLVLGGILLFWVALAVALSLVLIAVSVPFALVRWRAPGLPVIAVVWTLVGPLAATNAVLYALARVGTVLVDHYRTREATGHPLGRESGPSESGETAGDADGARAVSDEAPSGASADEDDEAS